MVIFTVSLDQASLFKIITQAQSLINLNDTNIIFCEFNSGIPLPKKRIILTIRLRLKNRHILYMYIYS